MWTGFEGFDQRGRKVVDNYFLKSELGTLRQKRKRNDNIEPQRPEKIQKIFRS